MNTLKKPLISIITVSYNAADTIEQTIQSVISQNLTDYEYIIVDGGSTDETMNIIKKYEHKITVWLSEPDKGIYDAMNKGVKLAKGEFISLLNSDDWYEKNTLQTIANYSVSNPDVDVFHGLLRFIDSNGNPDSIAGHYSSFLGKGMIEHPTCFIKKSVFQDVGDFSLKYKSASDFDWMMRAQSSGISFLLVPVILTNFRRGGMSDSYKSSLEELRIKRNYNAISKFKYFYWICILKFLDYRSKLEKA